jgi:hypothetical protein
LPAETAGNAIIIKSQSKGERVKTQTSETLVRIEEVILRCGGSRDAMNTWLAKFRVTPTSDWAGRPVVPADVAKKVVKAYEENAAEQALLQSEYDHYLKDRVRRLVEAGDEAYRQTAERELKAQYDVKFTGADGQGWAEGGVRYTNALVLWPYGRQKAREAALEAREEFEKREPLLRFDEWAKRRKR